MQKILLIGATGQLGTKIFEKLSGREKYSIRILIREDSNYEHLKSGHPEIFIGDLKDHESIKKAVVGCDIIITTANSAAPRKKEDSFKAVDEDGFRNLIDEAIKQEIKHFIYTSTAPVDKKYETWIPLCRSKVKTEAYLKQSGLSYTILQPGTFMDIYFIFLGTSIPAKGEPAALINRPFKFMQNFYNGIKNDIDKGKIGIIGNGKVKHTYIAIENVADFILKSIDSPELKNKAIPLGDPQALSPLEVKAIFEKVLNKQLKIKKTSPIIMKMMGGIFGFFNEGASNILKLNYMAAKASTNIDCTVLAEKLGIHLISAEEYLRSKLNEEG
jgi:NADH dehydrogenase